MLTSWWNKKAKEVVVLGSQGFPSFPASSPRPHSGLRPFLTSTAVSILQISVQTTLLQRWFLLLPCETQVPLHIFWPHLSQNFFLSFFWAFRNLHFYSVICYLAWEQHRAGTWCSAGQSVRSTVWGPWWGPRCEVHGVRSTEWGPQPCKGQLLPGGRVEWENEPWASSLGHLPLANPLNLFFTSTPSRIHVKYKPEDPANIYHTPQERVHRAQNGSLFISPERSSSDFPGLIAAEGVS